MTTTANAPVTHNAPISTRRGSPPRRWYLPASLVLAMTASACGAVPFIGDDTASQDIAAVDVEGIEPELNTNLSSSNSGETNSSPIAEADPQDSTTDDTESRLNSGDDTGADPDVEASDDDSPAVIETTDDRFIGRSVRYLVTDVELGTIVTTNVPVDDYLIGTDAETGDTHTTVEVNLTSVEGGSGSLDLELFGLVDADGIRYNATEAYTPRGDREYTVKIESQATTKLVLVFPEVDLDGASFVLSEAGRVPAIIRLTDTDSTQPGPYSFDVAPPTGPTDVTSNSFWEGCQHTFTAEIISATAVLDGRDGFSIERTSLDERFVVFDISLTNVTDTSLSPCGGYGPRPDILDPRLSIDGTTMAPFHIDDGANVEAGATVVGRFTFRVPTGSHDLVLSSITGDEIASWTVDIPSVDGE